MTSVLGKRRSPGPDNNNEYGHEDNGSQTPLGSPPRKKTRITHSQKQALIDNLQLESMNHFVLAPLRMHGSKVAFLTDIDWRASQ